MAKFAAAVRRAKRLRQRIRVGTRSHAVTLMYHRIATPSADPWDLSVSPRHFAQHLEVLQGWAVCQRFGDLVAAHASRTAPHRLAAITFDDGYQDNLAAALPLLEAHDTPATVFVVSGTLGVERDFWWDALTRVFLTTPSLPDTLELTTGRGVRVWHLGAGAHCTAADLNLLAAARLPFDARLHPRIGMLTEVRATLFPALPDEIERMCADICIWAGVDRAGAAGDHPMTPEGLQRLAASGLVEIGAHTVTHRPLDLLAPEEALAEMAGSRKPLREIIDREITTFSYPYGRFGPSMPGLVAEAGFAAACTTAQWVAVGATDPFRFPRIMVRDWDGDQFARILLQFAGAGLVSTG